MKDSVFFKQANLLLRVLPIINEHKVVPERVLLPVEGPAKKGKLDLAFKEVINEIKELNVNVVDFEDEEIIIKFAAADLDAETFNLNH